MLIHKG